MLNSDNIIKNSIVSSGETFKRESGTGATEKLKKNCIFIQHPEWWEEDKLNPVHAIFLLIYEFGSRAIALNAAQINYLLPDEVRISAAAIKKHIKAFIENNLIEGKITKKAVSASKYSDVFEITDTSLAWLKSKFDKENADVKFENFEQILITLKKEIQQLKTNNEDWTEECLDAYFSSGNSILQKKRSIYQGNTIQAIFSLLAYCEIKGWRWPTQEEMAKWIDPIYTARNKLNEHNKFSCSAISKNLRENDALVAIIDWFQNKQASIKVIINHNMLQENKYKSYLDLYTVLKKDMAIEMELDKEHNNEPQITNIENQDTALTIATTYTADTVLPLAIPKMNTDSSFMELINKFHNFKNNKKRNNQSQISPFFSKKTRPDIPPEITVPSTLCADGINTKVNPDSNANSSKLNDFGARISKS